MLAFRESANTVLMGTEKKCHDKGLCSRYCHTGKSSSTVFTSSSSVKPYITSVYVTVLNNTRGIITTGSLCPMTAVYVPVLSVTCHTVFLTDRS